MSYYVYLIVTEKTKNSRTSYVGYTNDLKRAESKTNKKFDQDNFVSNLLSTLRETINAPTRRRK